MDARGGEKARIGGGVEARSWRGAPAEEGVAPGRSARSAVETNTVLKNVWRPTLFKNILHW